MDSGFFAGMTPLTKNDDLAMSEPSPQQFLPGLESAFRHSDSPRSNVQN
jgi:hypothetical protein